MGETLSVDTEKNWILGKLRMRVERTREYKINAQEALTALKEDWGEPKFPGPTTTTCTHGKKVMSGLDWVLFLSPTFDHIVYFCSLSPLLLLYRNY